MAQRTAAIVITVDDKSLQELNDEIKLLEKNIKNLKVGTVEWNAENVKLGRLKNQFAQATSEARRLQNVVKQISGAEQLQSLLKVGRGIVGAFAAASQAVGLFGGQSEKLDEIVKKGQMFLTLMISLQEITQVFSKQNLAALAGVGRSFNKLVSTVKSSSMAIKASLAATGIGLLVIGVGLLIENWDKLKAVISGTSAKEKKAFEESQKSADERIKLLEDEKKAYEERNRLIEEFNKFKNNEVKTIGIVQQEIRNENDLLQTQINKYISINEQQSKDLDTLSKEEIEIKKQLDPLEQKLQKYNDIVEKGKELNSYQQGAVQGITQEIDKLKIKQEENKKIVESKREEWQTSGQILENLKLQQTLNKEYLDDRKLAAIENKDILKDANVALKTAQDELIVAQERKNNDMEVMRLRTIIATNQKIILENSGKLTDEERKVYDTLLKELDALGIKTSQYYEELKLKKQEYEYNLKLLESETERTKKTDELALAYTEILTQIDKEMLSYQFMNRTLDENVDKIKEEENIYKRIVALNEDKNDKARIYDTETRDFLKTLLGEYDKIEKLDNSRLGIFQERLDKASMELKFFKDLKEAENEVLENEKDKLEVILKRIAAEEENNNKIINRNEDDRKSVQELIDLENKRLSTLGEGAEFYDQRIASINKIRSYEKELRDLDQSDANIIQQNVNLQGERSDVQDEIISQQNQIYKNSKAINDETQSTVDGLKEQAKWYEEIEGWLANNAEEVQMTQAVIDQSFQLMSAIFEGRAQKLQDQYDELSEMYDEMNKKENARLKEQAKLEEELMDANGDRYDQLLQELEKVQAQKDANYISEEEQQANLKALEDARRAEELKAARWRKAQAIIDAVISTALAVVKALPNVFLAVATGVLGAASIATIAAQPTATYEEGGYTTKDTSDKKTVGTVHANEYVVPADVARSQQAQSHIDALERQRTRGYQEGGYVAPAATASSITQGIDYDKLASALAAAMSKLPNPQVAVTDISTGLRRVEVTKRLAGLKR